jgi:hypothetical protein
MMLLPQRGIESYSLGHFFIPVHTYLSAYANITNSYGMNHIFPKFYFKDTPSVSDMTVVEDRILKEVIKVK